MDAPGRTRLLLDFCASRMGVVLASPRRLRLVFVVITLLVLMIFGVFSLFSRSSEDITVTFGISMTNPGGQPARDVRVLLTAPEETTPFQSVRSLEASQPYRAVQDASGNRLLEFKIPALAAGERKPLTVTARLEVSGKHRWRVLPVSRADFLPEKFIESDSDEIRALAIELIPDATALSATDLLAAVNRRVILDETSPDGGALQALRHGKGSRIDRACLMAALLRSREVAARVVLGFAFSPQHERGEIRASRSDLSAWTVAFRDDDWQLLDPNRPKPWLRVALRHMSVPTELDLPPIGWRELAWLPDEFSAHEEN